MSDTGRPDRPEITAEPVNYGGQAVIEGVMMRGPRFYAVACRRENGEIVEVVENVESFIRRWSWLQRPFLRGTLALIDSMTLGMKALRFSADVAMKDANDAEKGPANAPAAMTAAGSASVPSAIASSDGLSSSPSEHRSLNDIAIAGTMVLSLFLGVGLFMLLPSILAGFTRPWISGHVGLNIVEGLARLALFLGYLGVISRIDGIHRVFQYHGAEHKTINAYESKAELTPESVRRFSRIHPRCGTSFILIVLIVATLAHSVMGWPVWYWRLLSRVAVLPIVAGISYEIVRFAGRRRDIGWLQTLLRPGLKTQCLTTREPTDDQIEVAIHALNRVIERDGALELTPAATRP